MKASPPRRSSRKTSKPKPIYHTGAPKDDNASDGEASEEDDDEDFVDSGSKRKSPPTKGSNKKKKKALGLSSSKARKATPKRSSNQQSGRKSSSMLRSVVEEASDSDEQESWTNELFDAVRRPNTALDGTVKEWLTRFETSPGPAQVELINFVFQSCGGSKNYVEQDEDLDELDIDTVMGEVTSDLQNENEDVQYPITSKKREFKKFRQNFKEFWKRLALESHQHHDMLVTCVEYLTSISSCSLQTARHTATEAGFEISHALVEVVNEITEKVEVATRQLEAEAKKGSSQSKKANQLKQNIKRMEQKSNEKQELIGQIFTSFFVHRYRDIVPELRCISLAWLGETVYSFPAVFLDDKFVKYLGWMLSDKEPAVRLAAEDALINLYEDETFAEHLELFTSRFLDRYVAMADDTDTQVALSALKLLQAVMRADAEIEITEDHFHSISSLVFNEEAEVGEGAAKCLQQYMSVFEEVEGEDETESKKKQRATAQLRALLELAEDHISGGSGGDTDEGTDDEPAITERRRCIDNMVAAFWNLEDNSEPLPALRNWSVITSMLLSDAENMNALSENQQLMLMRILFASVHCLKADLLTSKTKRKVKGGAVAAKQQQEMNKTEMSVHLVKCLPDLLVKYQTDASIIADSAKIIPCLNLQAYTRQQKNFTKLLKRLKASYTTLPSNEALTSIAEALAFLAAEDHSRQREAEIALHELAEQATDQIEEILSQMVNPKATLSSKKEGKGNKKHDSRATEYSLGLWMRRLVRLMDNCCVQDDTKKLRTSLEQLIDDRCTGVGTFAGLEADALDPTVVQCTLRLLYHHLLYDLLAVTDAVEELEGSSKQQKKGKGKGDSPKKKKKKEVEEDVAKVQEQRDVVLEKLDKVWACTEHNEEDDLSDAQSNFVSEVQSSAYSMLCDMHLLFTNRLKDTVLLSTLAIETSPVSSLPPAFKAKFESGMHDISKKDAALLETEADKTANVSKEEWQLREQVNEILVSLGKTVLFDLGNKRQAAMATNHFVQSGQASADVVKYLTMNIKKMHPVRFLEIQMQVLRACFASNILSLDDDSNEDEMADGYDKLTSLARRLATTFGVNKKITEPELRKSFNRFMQEGVRFSLSEPKNLTFLDAMKCFLRLVPKPDIVSLSDHFDTLVEKFPETVQEIMDEEEELTPDTRSLEWGAFFEFFADLKKAAPKKHNVWPVSAIKSAASSPAGSEGEVEMEMDLNATTRRKLSMSSSRSGSKSGSTSSSESKRRSSAASDRYSALDDSDDENENENDSDGNEAEDSGSGIRKEGSQTAGWEVDSPTKITSKFGRSSEEKKQARLSNSKRASSSESGRKKNRRDSGMDTDSGLDSDDEEIVTSKKGKRRKQTS